MPLRVASMALGKSRVSADILKVLDFDQPVQPVTDTLASELETAPVNTVLLYTSLASCLQSALVACEGDVQGVTSKAFRQWQDQATTLIHLAKRYRKQVLMFDEAAVCQYPEEFVKLCAELWAIEVSDQPDHPAPEVPEREAVVELVETELLRRHPQVSRLAGQLMALSQPLGDQEPLRIDVFSVLADYQNSKSSVLTLDAQLTQSRRDNEALVQAKTDSNKALQASQSAAQQTRSELVAVQEEANLLLVQLHAVQEELEQQQLAKAEAEKAADAKLKALEASWAKAEKAAADALLTHEGQLAKARSEAKVALKAKTDSDKALQTNQSALQQTQSELVAVQEEANLLLEQLHAVQEVLEQQYLAKSETDKAIDNKVKALEASLAKVKQEATATLKIKAQLEQSLHALTQEYTQATQQWSSVDRENAKLAQQLLNLEKQQAAGLQVQANKEKENVQLTKKLSDISQQLEAQSQQQKRINQLEAEIKALKSELKAASEISKPLAGSKPADNEKLVGVKTAQLEAELKELSEENALLLEQLHYVQEEIERIYLGPKQQGLSDELIQSLLRSLQRVTYPDLNKTQQKQLVDKGFFNGAWYVKAYKDVAGNVSAAQAPLNHFLRHGFFEGRNPCADKNTLAFIQQHPAMLTTQEHPVLYWFLQSAAENNA